jgi:hypothetical protein
MVGSRSIISTKIYIFNITSLFDPISVAYGSVEWLVIYQPVTAVEPLYVYSCQALFIKKSLHSSPCFFEPEQPSDCSLVAQET